MTETEFPDSRNKAREQGVKYYHGKICDNCRNSLRYAKNGACYKCILDRSRRWKSENPMKVKIQRERWYEANREWCLQYAKDWVRNNKERRREYMRQYLPIWSELNREHHNEIRRSWDRENKGKVNAKTARRRSMRSNATPPWANQQRIAKLYEECPDGYHVDHVIPLQGRNVCGLHCEDNLQYLPAHENHVKSNKFLDRRD